jgi:hypothetical protein
VQLRRLAQFVLPKASMVFQRRGAIVAFKIEDKLIVRVGRRI